MREYESASSITTFLKCPYAYYLSYIKKVKGKVTKKVELGQWVHKQLELMPKNHPDAEEFCVALGDYLDKENDEIVEKERIVEFEFNGYRFRCVFDAVTEKGQMLEYKVTASPGYYQSMISYQAGLYSLASLGKLRPIYLFFEANFDYDKVKFKKLHTSDIVTTKMGDFEFIQNVLRIRSMIDNCWSTMNFPPAYNGCAGCFYKDSCDYYWGF